MVFDERQWARLLLDIEDRQVIPIVGPETLVLDLDGRKARLYEHLACELASRLGVDTSQLPAGFGMDDVISEYRGDADDIYLIRAIFRERQWPVPDPLRLLAEIQQFDVYVSLTFDTLLEKALATARGYEPVSVAYARTGRLADLPDRYRELMGVAGAGRVEPAVYQLFGKLNALNDYALREEDILQFCYRLQSEDKQPENLFDLLRTRSLLVIGCGFPGWLTRFFLAAAKGEQLFDKGARGVVADSTSAQDRSLVHFLERRKTALYAPGDAIAFIVELHRRCKDRFGAVPPAAPEASAPSKCKRGSIFISYASEDRNAARAIRDALDAAGVDTWFDEERLEGGDRFEEVIRMNIAECSCFLPVISRRTYAERRFLNFEWNLARREVDFRRDIDRFIVPVVVDDTPPDSPDIPSAFRQVHWQRLEGGRLPAEFIEALRRRIKERRREEPPE